MIKSLSVFNSLTRKKNLLIKAFTSKPPDRGGSYTKMFDQSKKETVDKNQSTQNKTNKNEVVEETPSKESLSDPTKQGNNIYNDKVIKNETESSQEANEDANSKKNKLFNLNYFMNYIFKKPETKENQANESNQSIKAEINKYNVVTNNSSKLNQPSEKINNTKTPILNSSTYVPKPINIINKRETQDLKPNPKQFTAQDSIQEPKTFNKLSQKFSPNSQKQSDKLPNEIVNVIMQNKPNKPNKPILLKKTEQEEDTDDFGQHNLNNMSEKSPAFVGRKWEQFFRKNSKPLLDTNRAINNTPNNNRYIEFFNDYKRQFNEEQLLFALKNILVCDNTVNMTSNEVNGYLSYQISTNQFDTSSKTNLFGILEILFMQNYVVRQPSYNNHMGILESIMNSLKIFSNDLEIQEYLFAMNTLLTNYNVYDSFLVQNFFDKFDFKNINEILTNKIVYKIQYFGNEVKLIKTIFQVFDHYVKFVKSTSGKIPEKNLNLILLSLESFITLLNNDKILLSDLYGVVIDFSNIVSVLDIEESTKLEKAINNLFLKKISLYLSQFYPENKNSLISSEILNISTMLINIRNGSCNQDLFEEVFGMLCELMKTKFDSTEFLKILWTISSDKWSVEYAIQQKILYNTILNLMEISINTNFYNKALVEVFLVCLEADLSGNESFWSKYTISSSKFLTLFGKYNFDEILKTEKFKSYTYSNYFNILSNIDKCVYKSMTDIFNLIKSENVDFENKLSTDSKVYEINKEFYTNFFGLQKESRAEHETLVHQKELILEENVKFFLERFSEIPKAYQMCTYFDKETLFHPLSTIKQNRIASSIAIAFETLLDQMMVLINYKLVNTNHVNLFLDILNELNIIKSSSESSTYDGLIKELILSNLQIFKKFALVVDFIFSPQNYYDPFDKHLKKNSLENFEEFFKHHYSLEHYNIEEDYNPVNLKTNEFCDNSGHNFMEATSGLVSFSSQENFDEVKKIVEEVQSNDFNINPSIKDFESHHRNFIHKAMNFEFGSFYTSPKVLNFIQFKDLNKFNEMYQNEDSNYNNFNLNKATLIKHSTVYKVIMDISKITQTLEKSVISTNSLEDILDRISNFYVKTETPYDELNYNQNFKFQNFTNMSTINTDTIINSHIHFEFLRNYLACMIQENEKSVDLKKYKIDKILNKAFKFYPVAPFVTHYGFLAKTQSNFTEVDSKNENLKNWLIILNEKYSRIDVRDIKKINELSFLKSQYENIMIFD